MVAEDAARDLGEQPSRTRHNDTVRLVFRTPLWHRLVGVAGFLLAAVAAFAAAINFGGLVRPLATAIGVYPLFMAWRMWRLRIEADDDGILVVDFRKRTRVPWDDIRYFSWDPFLSVEMRDRSSLVPVVFSPRVLPITGQLDYLIPATGRRLQEELRRHKQRP